MISKLIKLVFVGWLAYFIASIFVIFVPPVINHSPKMLAIIPAALILGLAFVIRPLSVIFFILATRVIFNPFFERDGAGGGMGPGAVLNLFVILAAIVICFKHFKRIIKVPFVRHWIIFLGVTLIAITYSSSGFSAIRQWLNNLTYLAILGIAMTCISSMKDIRKWFFMIAVTSVVPVAMAIIHGALNGTLTSRIAFPFPHPSMLAHYTVIALMITTSVMWFFSDPSANSRNILKIPIILLVVALVLTQTRNAWIACWAAYFIFGVIQRNKVTIIVCIGAPLLFLCLPVVQERIANAFTNYHQTSTEGMNSLAWRMQLWSDSWPWILEKPLFGHGLSTFLPYSPEFSPTLVSQPMGAHNVYIELLFDAGLMGLIAYLLIFFFLFQKIIFYYKVLQNDRDRGVAALLISYMIGYMIICYIDNLQQILVINWYIWFFIGAMYRYLQLSYENQTGTPTSS